MTIQATIPAAGGAASPPEQEKTPVAGAPEATTPAAGDEKQPGQPDAAKKGTGSEGEDDSERRKQKSFDRRMRYQVERRRQAEAEAEEVRQENAHLRRELERLRGVDVSNLDYEQREELRLKRVLTEQELARNQQRQRQAERGISEAEVEDLRSMAEEVSQRLSRANDPDLAPLLEDEDFPLSPDMVEFLHGSEHAAAVAKHLAKNPKVARELARLTSRRTATAASIKEAWLRMGRIEAEIARGLPAARKATKAPDPGTTLNGGSPPPSNAPLHEIADAGEYVRRRLQDWKEGRP